MVTDWNGELQGLTSPSTEGGRKGLSLGEGWDAVRQWMHFLDTHGLL